MPAKIGSHYGDETLERYALGDLRGDMIPELEEHLLVCENCQIRLEQAEQFLDLARVACERVRKERRETARKGIGSAWVFRTPRLLWAGGLALLAVTVWMPGLRVTRRADRAAVGLVELRTLRGAGDEMVAHAAAGPMVVTADVSEVRPLPAYVLRLVDAGGSEVWSARVQAVGPKIRQRAPRAVKAGRYWVRLCSPDGELLREYALEVK